VAEVLRRCAVPDTVSSHAYAGHDVHSLHPGSVAKGERAGDGNLIGRRKLLAGKAGEIGRSDGIDAVRSGMSSWRNTVGLGMQLPPLTPQAPLSGCITGQPSAPLGSPLVSAPGLTCEKSSPRIRPKTRSS